MTRHTLQRHPLAAAFLYASLSLLLLTPLSVVAGGSPYVAVAFLVAGIAALVTATRLSGHRSHHFEDADDWLSAQLHPEVSRGLREAERYANQHH